MPDAPHILRVPAALGIEESSREELVEFGAKNLACENIRQFQVGEAGVRYGFDALSGGRFDATTSTAGYKLFAHHADIVRVTDTLQAEAYSSKATAWSPLGRVPNCTASLTDLPTMGTAGTLEDIDVTNGYVATSWLSQTGTSYSAFAAITDEATGAVVRAPESVGTSTAGRPGLLAHQDNYFILVRYNTVGTKIEAWYLDTTSASTIGNGWVAFGAALCTDCDGGPFHAGAAYVVHSLPHASTPRVALLYCNTGGGTDQLTLKTFNIGGIVQTQAILTDSITPVTVAIGGSSTDTLWLAWDEVSAVMVRGVDPFTITTDLATRTNPFNVTTSVTYMGISGSTVAGKARVWAEDVSGTHSYMGGIKTVAGAAAGDGVYQIVVGVHMVRKPFCIDGRHYSGFFGGDSLNAQNNFFVCDWTEDVPYLRPVANPAPSTATTGLYGLGKFAEGSDVLYAGFNTRRSAVADGAARLNLDFSDRQRWQTVRHGDATFLGGGVLSYFDGLRVAEVGFLYRPTKPTTTTSGTGITAVTGWRYVAVYEETDGEGNWCVSGLSDPSASTGAVANKTVNVFTLPLSITSRATPDGAAARGTRVAIYRTLDGGVAPYYRVGTFINDYSLLAPSYADQTSDATLATRSKLYSQPGVVGTSQDRRAPPGLLNPVSYNGMLVGSQGSNVWYSGQDVTGEATWFNPIFQVPVPGEGDITALAVMDGGLYVFKRREVYAIVGDAPSDNAASGGLGNPRRIAVDVGAAQFPTCTTAYGIIFCSDRGIELLTRAQSVEWLGEDVLETFAAFPVCTSITVDPSSSCVLVELSEATANGRASGNGRTLVYDLNLKVWVSSDRRKSVAAVADSPSQSACMVYMGGDWRYAWLSTTGRVHYETRSHLDANGGFITPLVETAWFKGFDNEQRVRTLSVCFERYTAAGLKIESAYDYGAYDINDDRTWTEIDTSNQRQLELMSPKPRGESVKFRVSATAPAVLGTGQGLGFISLVLDIQPKQGPTNGTLRLDPALRK